MRVKIIIFKLFRLLTLRFFNFSKYGKSNRISIFAYLSSFSSIGDYNFISPFTFIGNCTIGNYCSIGPGAKIGLAEHSIDFLTTSQIISKKMINYNMYEKKVVIGHDVWIGSDAIIMAGVKIGNGSVIGANAVITKDVPDYSIIVGIPGRFLRSRFSSRKILLLEQSKWFLKDVKEALNILKEINKSE